jgi:prepilin-type processing-associated H-X9-DG protein
MKRGGWTLVEMLTVLGVTGILFGLLLPAVQQARASAERVKCLNQLKQVGHALLNYEATQGRLPPKSNRRYPARDVDAALGWMALILPQMGETNVYRSAEIACQADPNPLRNPPHGALSAVIPSYVCPADGRLTPMTDGWGRTAAFTSYLGVAGTIKPSAKQVVGRVYAGVFGTIPGIRLTDIADGASQTLMVGERPPPDSLQAGWWYPVFGGDTRGWIGPNNFLWFGAIQLPSEDPGCVADKHFFGPGRLDNPCDRYHFWSLHPGGGHWLYADGSVHFLPYSADPILPALATRTGGEVIELP